jgi:hypothetical protein
MPPSGAVYQRIHSLGTATVSDPIEKTAAGATRSFFGALGFILLMVGVEGMNGHLQLVDIFLALAGALCFYLAFFWESAKRHLSADTQLAIGQFAQSRVVKFGMLFLVLQTIILSRFVEERRWPFSYPADPMVYAEKSRFETALNQANGTIGREKELADKWRFATTLKSLQKECRFHADVSRKAASVGPFWEELLHLGGWIGVAGGAQDGLQLPAGITLRIPGNNSPCAGTLQRALADIYPNPPSKIAINQQTAFLSSCAGQSGQDCVQIEIDY